MAEAALTCSSAATQRKHLKAIIVISTSVSFYYQFTCIKGELTLTNQTNKKYLSLSQQTSHIFICIIYLFSSSHRHIIAPCISSSSGALKGSLQQLPLGFSTKKKLIGFGILIPTKRVFSWSLARWMFAILDLERSEVPR